MSDALNRGEKLKLKNGEKFGLYSMRPDGVHLSDHGSRYVVENIEQQLTEHPPTVNPAVCGTGKRYVGRAR